MSNRFVYFTCKRGNETCAEFNLKIDESTELLDTKTFDDYDTNELLQLSDINVNLKMYSFDHLRMYNIDHIETCLSRW